MVGDVNDARRYILRAKEGYETLLGRDHVTTIQAQIQVIRISCTSDEELLEKTQNDAQEVREGVGRGALYNVEFTQKPR